MHKKFVHVVLKIYSKKSWLENLCIKIMSIIKSVLKNYHLIVMLKKILSNSCLEKLKSYTYK